jgi:hypothetical protein
MSNVGREVGHLPKPEGRGVVGAEATKMVLLSGGLVALGMLLAAVYPRAPSWQILEMRYNRMNVNLDFTADAEVSIGLVMSNPNVVPAHVQNVTLLLLHTDIYGQESAFGVIRVDGDFDLPAHGSHQVQSLMTIDHIPVGVGLSMYGDMRDNDGVVVTKTLAYTTVRVLWRSLELEAECMQHLKADVFPMVVTKIECNYFMFGGALRIPMLPAEVPADVDVVTV